MVGFKKVPSLKDSVKREIPTIVKNYIIKSAYNLNIQWYVICAGYTNTSSQEILTLQMEKFRKFLLENIVWTDREEIFYLILRGVDEGIMKVRRGWSKDKKHDQYMKVMEAVTLFTDTVQFPDLRAIDFGEIPRPIRYRIMEMIPFFTRLKVLIIGPGNAGSWIPIKVSLVLFRPADNQSGVLIAGQNCLGTLQSYQPADKLGVFLSEERLQYEDPDLAGRNLQGQLENTGC